MVSSAYSAYFKVKEHTVKLLSLAALNFDSYKY